MGFHERARATPRSPAYDVEVQFFALGARGDAINTRSREVLLDLRFALRDQLSETQWRTLFPASGHQAD